MVSSLLVTLMWFFCVDGGMGSYPYIAQGHLQEGIDGPHLEDQRSPIEFKGELILSGCHGFSFVYVHNFRTSTSVLDSWF
uniref:Uncharacterized protein n=1 Tax=Solanum tuberosum TaxID=4113 RepID=M1DLT5_SOLTU